MLTAARNRWNQFALNILNMDEGFSFQQEFPAVSALVTIEFDI